jgi:hypothetical protein
VIYAALQHAFALQHEEFDAHKRSLSIAPHNAANFPVGGKAQISFIAQSLGDSSLTS